MRSKCVLLFLFAVLLLVGVEASRRSRGRSRGSSSGGNYGRSKPKYPTQHVDPVALSYGHQNKKAPDLPKPAQKPSAPPADNPGGIKPSAPVSETVGKQTVGTQNSAAPQSGNQRPIGWNVDGNKEGAAGKDVGWNVGQQPHGSAGQAAVGSHQQAPYPNTPGGQAAPTGSHIPHQQASYPNQNQQPGVGQQYPQQPGFGAGQQPIPHQQSSYPNQNQQPGFGQQYPQQPGFGAGQQPGYGVGPPGYSAGQHPHYQQQYPHYQQPGYGQAGYPGYPQQPGGFGYGGYGGGFGGNTWSPFGGGGGGGYGMNNYYQKSSGGFFGKHAFRNVLAGLLVWNLVRGFTSTPYHVYHYYHRPDNIPENIPLPANTIVLCDNNSTSICTPNTIPLCTTNNTIFCVATMSATNPCSGNTTTPCLNSTIPCANADDPLCANKTIENNATTISIPCLANVTILGKVDLPQNATFNTSIQLNGGETVYCLTTMALPDPANATVAPPAAMVCDGNSTENCSPPPPSLQMCEGNSTEGCVPGVIPLSTTTTTTVLPTVDNATKESVTNESTTPAAS